jgi:hypothetical protein
MDDHLVSRIQFYLNENHERDIKVSKDFEDDSQFEKNLGKQHFDTSHDEAVKESRKEWLGDNARQQELIFELKAKQLKID